MELMEKNHSLVRENSFELSLFSNERNRALSLLPKLSFPTTKIENWKYTRVGKISNQEWKKGDVASIENLDAYRIPEWNGSTLVFVNGEFQESLSEIKSEDEGIKVKPMSKACENCENQLKGNFAYHTEKSKNIFDQINASSWQNGLFVYVPKGKHLRNAVHVISIMNGDAVAAHMRNVFVVEESAQAEIIYSAIGNNSGKTYQNVISEINVGKNASLNFDKIQQSGKEEFQIMTESVRQAKDSRFSINTITIDAGWVRNDLNIEVQDENCETNLYGVYLPIDNQHIDNHTVVDHQMPHCNSNEMYKGVIYDKATGVFNGKVFVREDAQKTNAFQANNNIIMSEFATMNSKPELEIYADDVKCSHGSTTGQFDEEAVFYLRARGIGEINARKLLVGAFLSDALENIQNEQVKSYVETLLEEKQAKILS